MQVPKDNLFMSNTKLLFLIFALFVSCNSKTQIIQVKNIYKDVFETNTYLSLDKNAITILEDMSLDMDSIDKEFFYKKIIGKNDSLVKENFTSIFGKEIQNVNLNSGNSRIHIENFLSNKFLYDPTPSKSVYLINKNEFIAHSKRDKKFEYFITRDSNTTSQKLYISNLSNQELISINLPNNIETPDFLLFDVIGDDQPEIFIFTKVYFMGKNLVEFNVFKIEKVLSYKTF
jgi:hypothetical protein